MRPNGSPIALEQRRRLAVQRVREGYSTPEVADLLGVDPCAVRRGVAAFRRHGDKGLSAGPVPGRPPKLTPTQEKIVRRWLADRPTDYGFPTERWTGPRLALLLQQEFGVRSPPWDLSRGLRDRGSPPQRPQRVPRQRDPEASAQGRESDGPRLPKRPDAKRRISP